jgi:hypothetical protein
MLASKHEALSSSPSTALERKEWREGGRKEEKKETL